MYILVKFLRRHKHKFTFDEQVRACSSAYVNSSNMDYSLETTIVSAKCGTTRGEICGNISTVGKKKGKGRISRKRYYIIAYTSLIRVYILLFFEPCYRRSNSARVYFDNFLERSSRAYSISCLIKGSKFTSSEISRKPEKFKFEIVYSLVKRTEAR